MRLQCWTLALWTAVDALFLLAAPRHVAAFQALDSYTRHRHDFAILLIVGAGFGTCAIMDAVAGYTRDRLLTAIALSTTFTWVFVWAALGVLVAVAGYGDYGRLTLYGFILWLIGIGVHDAWVVWKIDGAGVDPAEAAKDVRNLRRERRTLERRRQT